MRDLIVDCNIGIHDFEKEAPQRVRFTVDMELRASRPLTSERVVADIRAMIGDGHVNLVETLAERVAALCLRDPAVRRARVRVEKLDIFAEAASVGVEIERLSPFP